MNQISSRQVIRMALVFLGLFGVGLAISGLLVALPVPAAGGTCGPGKGSEAPIAALFDPISIGAGPEPPASETAAHAQWVAFVSECQTAADNRGMAAVAILAVSAGVALVLPLLLFRRKKQKSSDFVLPSPADPYWQYRGTA
jgi:hypothetical protein